MGKSVVSINYKKSKSLQKLIELENKIKPGVKVENIPIHVDIDLTSHNFQIGIDYRKKLINLIADTIENKPFYNIFISKVNKEKLLNTKLPGIVQVNGQYITTMVLEVTVQAFDTEKDTVHMKLYIDTNDGINSARIEAVNDLMECIINTGSMILYDENDKIVLENKITGRKYYNNDDVHVKITKIIPPYNINGFGPRLIAEGEIK